MALKVKQTTAGFRVPESCRRSSPGAVLLLACASRQVRLLLARGKVLEASTVRRGSTSTMIAGARVLVLIYVTMAKEHGQPILYLRVQLRHHCPFPSLMLCPSYCGMSWSSWWLLPWEPGAPRLHLKFMASQQPPWLWLCSGPFNPHANRHTVTTVKMVHL